MEISWIQVGTALGTARIGYALRLEPNFQNINLD